MVSDQYIKQFNCISFDNFCDYIIQLQIENKTENLETYLKKMSVYQIGIFISHLIESTLVDQQTETKLLRFASDSLCSKRKK